MKRIYNGPNRREIYVFWVASQKRLSFERSFKVTASHSDGYEKKIFFDQTSI
jgi:hypothetical protein